MTCILSLFHSFHFSNKMKIHSGMISFFYENMKNIQLYDVRFVISNQRVILLTSMFQSFHMIYLVVKNMKIHRCIRFHSFSEKYLINIVITMFIRYFSLNFIFSTNMKINSCMMFVKEYINPETH